LIGEKHVPPDGLGRADAGDGSLYDGQNPASCARVAGPGHGLAASVTEPFNNNFGSPHRGFCQFLYADGSVRPITVGINEAVLGQLARRGKQE
jgi:prepilin-type processing-associated H-X9-DG protein